MTALWLIWILRFFGVDREVAMAGLFSKTEASAFEPFSLALSLARGVLDVGEMDMAACFSIRSLGSAAALPTPNHELFGFFRCFAFGSYASRRR